MKKPDSIYEIEKKRSGFIAGTVSAWLAVPILLLPLIVSFNSGSARSPRPLKVVG